MALNTSTISLSSLDDSQRDTTNQSHDQTHETIIELEQEMDKLSCELLDLQVNAIEYIIELTTKFGSEIDFDTASLIKSCGDCQQFYVLCQERITNLENILVSSDSKVEVKHTAIVTPPGSSAPETVNLEDMNELEDEHHGDVSIKAEPIEDTPLIIV